MLVLLLIFLREVNQHSSLILILLIPLKIQMLDSEKNVNSKKFKSTNDRPWKKNIKKKVDFGRFIVY